MATVQSAIFTPLPTNTASATMTATATETSSPTNTLTATNTLIVPSETPTTTFTLVANTETLMPIDTATTTFTPVVNTETLTATAPAEVTETTQVEMTEAVAIPNQQQLVESSAPMGMASIGLEENQTANFGSPSAFSANVNPNDLTITFIDDFDGTLPNSDNGEREANAQLQTNPNIRPDITVSITECFPLSNNSACADYEQTSTSAGQVELSVSVIVDFDRDYTVTSAFRLLSWSTFPSNTEPIRTHLTEAIMRDKDGVDIYHSTCTLDLIFIQCSSFTYDPYDSQLPVDNVRQIEFIHRTNGSFNANAVSEYKLNIDGIRISVISTTCEEGQIALVDTFPGTSNEALDMRSIAQAEGLILHDGPTINSRRMAILDWQQPIVADAYIEFPQTNQNSQLWYRITQFRENNITYSYNEATSAWESNSPAPPAFLDLLNQAQDVWITARHPDVGSSNTFTYIEGVTDVINPCLSLEDARANNSNLTFLYDRETASDFGIAQGIQNSAFATSNPQPSGFQNATYRVNDIPFANFQYNILFGPQGQTASAVFISEILWMGGFSMTQNIPNECVANPLPTDNTGWRFCDGNLSTSWRIHEGVAEYYTNGYVPSRNSQVGGGEETIDGNTFLDSMGTMVGQQVMPVNATGETFIRSQDLAVDGIGTDFFNLGSGATFGNQDFSAFSQWLRESIDPSGDTIQHGDYIWIRPLSGDDHGFIIVGWQAAVNCQQALDNGFSEYYSTYNDAQANSINAPIPYVVDFTRLQQVKPRPFFCTWYSDPASTYDDPNTPENDANRFTDHNWYFYTMPDAIILAPNNVYVDPVWSWSNIDGNFPYSQ